jgi:hypothetical protein
MATQNQANDDNQSASETARLNRSAAAINRAAATTTQNNTNINVQLSNDYINRRLYNPLGNFASYTYQISLYMVSPEAYQAFVSSNRSNVKNINGFYLVAQSGGSNNKNKENTVSNLDYYIDNMSIVQSFSGKGSGASINISDIKFEIIEPYGFSFPTKLTAAFENLKANSNFKGIENSIEAIKSFFVVGIRFQGYDENGVPLSSSNFPTSSFTTNIGAQGVFEQFIDIKLKTFKFKLDGFGATKYQLVAAKTDENIGFGTKYGIVDNVSPLIGSTVEELLIGEAQGLTSLKQLLNQNQQGRSVPITYDFRFKGDEATVNSIKNAKLVNLKDNDRARNPSSLASNSSQVNESTAAASVPTNLKTIWQFNSGMAVPQIVENLIKQSTYVTNALTFNYTSSETPNNTGTPNIINQKSDPPELKWYNLSAEVTPTAYDNSNDFSYHITYIIQPFTNPTVNTPFTKSPVYPGPDKLYEYWLTGKNKEIISLELSYDQTYFQISLTEPGQLGDPVSTITGKKNDQDQTGGKNVKNEAVNTITTQLNDPGAYKNVKIKTLGDPDWLHSFSNQNSAVIDPNSQSIFVEVVLKEGIDYNNNTGLLDINNSISFWNYSDTFKKNNNIQGAIFLVKKVISTFSGGAFTQDLECSVPVFTEPKDNNIDGTATGTTIGTTPAQTTPTAGSATAQGSGYSVVAPINIGVFKTPALSSNGINSVYGSAAVGSSLGPTGTFLDGTQRNLVNDDAALSVGAGTTQAGKVDETTMSVNQRLSNFSQRVSAFFKPGTPPPARAPGSVPGGVTRINPSDIQPM